jgi:branched-chain amino acid aminotransferase
MKQFALSDWPELAAALRRRYQSNYFAMYSSLYRGVVTDPVLMMLPIDDHIVHRGDGVFEALKAVRGSIYNFHGHFERLESSARGLALPMPESFERLRDIVAATFRAAGRPDAMLRIYVSRGPGGFGVNPYECPASQLYVVVTALGTPFMRLHPEGARVRTSSIPAKSTAMAIIKNCNYAPNVLKLDRILAGTTMLRVMALAEELARNGRLTGVAFADITREDIAHAREFLVTGTTINVAAAVSFDGRPIADGRPGPLWRELNDLLDRDMRENTALLTPVP